MANCENSNRFYDSPLNNPITSIMLLDSHFEITVFREKLYCITLFHYYWCDSVFELLISMMVCVTRVMRCNYYCVIINFQYNIL